MSEQRLLPLYSLDMIIATSQGETKPPFGMIAQGPGQGKIACLYVNLHRYLLENVVVTWPTSILNALDYLEKSIIIAAQFVFNEVLVNA